MFDLAQSIAKWRKQMLAAGIKSPALLDELESHLREEVDLQMHTGFDVRFAFDIAVEKIGNAPFIKTEFNKIERNHMKMTLILLGIFGVLFGMAIVLPAMAWFRGHHAISADEHMANFLIGLLIVTSGLGSGIYGFKKRKA